MSADNGKCDAIGYDAKDMEEVVDGRKPQPWYCEKAYGHDDPHDMPNLRRMFGDPKVDLRVGHIAWFDRKEVTK